MIRALLLFALVTAAPVAAAREQTPCQDGPTVILDDNVCTGPCNGITIVVLASGNCRGRSGAPGQDGGDACSGTNVVIGGSGNCEGGAGGAGSPTQPAGDGGDGCWGYNVVVGDNCQGGDGGDA